MTRTIEAVPNGRSMIPFAEIRAECCIPVQEDDLALIAEADNGKAGAQTDLALLFLSNGRPKNALHWLELAVKQKDTDAMHWLGRCYIEGTGLSRDENLGIMWLSRAAAEGHVISQEMMQGFRQKALRPDSATS